MHTYPKLNGIDHVHIYVSDRSTSADWYQQVLGFSVVDTLKSWADDPHGPLTLQDAEEKIHIALFQRSTFTPSSALAFAADGDQFLQWKQHLEKHGLLSRIADHQLAWSMYFNDPDNNMHEITTYQYQHVSQALEVN